jgi:ATP-dependent Clp protease adaptor protein ClpS
MSTKTLPKTFPSEQTKTRRQPPYAVVLHNDDVNTVEFVVMVVRKVFGYPLLKCFELVLEAHESGRSVVWVGPLEVAELKAEQIHSCGPDPDRRAQGALPLGVSLEPVCG